RAARGEVLLPRVDRVTYDEARADLIKFYKTYETRDIGEAEARLRHLDAFFAKRRLATITPDVVTSYADERRAGEGDEKGETTPGAADGAIKPEPETLDKSRRPPYKNGKLTRMPLLETLAQAPPRAGFVTREQFDTFRKRLPEQLRVSMTVAYTFGWRKREVLDLKKHQYNSQDGTLRLDPGTTKNGEGRVVKVTPELRALLDTQVARVRELERRLERVIPWLFPHLEGALAGQRVSDPRKAWESACKVAGLPGLLIHDLRRSAVRNMEQASVPRSVAMKLAGHKTENVYRRYANVSEADLEAGGRRLLGGGAGGFVRGGAPPGRGAAGRWGTAPPATPRPGE